MLGGDTNLTNAANKWVKRALLEEKRKMGGNKRPLRSLRSNNSGVLYVYLVIIIAILAVGFFAFIMSTGLGKIQENLNPSLGEDKWSTPQHFEAFNLAATFVSNLWVLFPAVLLFGLAYWGYVEAQRRHD